MSSAICVCGHKSRFHRDDRRNACSKCRDKGCFAGFIRAAKEGIEL